MDQVKTCKCEELSEEEKLVLIREVIEEYKGQEGNLIQVLHLVQAIYGYLPLHIQKVIAQGLDKPLSEVSGVVSFYTLFSTKPRGKHTINVCLGTACYVRGGKKIVDRLKALLEVDIGDTTSDNKFTLEVMRCMGACGLAPAMSIDDKIYKQVNPDKLTEILDLYN